MTHNERLFELQSKLGNGSDSAVLDEMYRALYRIARGIAPKHGRKGRAELDSLEDISHDAAAEVIRRYLDPKGYRVTKCFKAVVHNAIRDRTRPKLLFDQMVDQLDSVEEIE